MQSLIASVPYESVEALKASALWKRMPMLQRFGVDRLRRFIAVLNDIVARGLRNGASPEEAEARAIPIALTAAKGHSPPPASRQAEAATLLVPLITKHMASTVIDDPGAAASHDLVFPDAVDVNAVMAGNVFYGRAHLPLEPTIAEAQGVIRRVMARSDVPADKRDLIDPDFPLVAEVSFFDDVPADERISEYSPEWFEWRLAGNKTLAIPYTLATTDQPANPAELGFRMVAKAANPVASKHNKPHTRSQERRTTMPGDDSTDPNQEAAAKMATLQKELDIYQQKLAAAQKAADEATRRANDLIAADQQRQAEDFAKETFTNKEVPVSAQPKLAAMFLKDPEGAAEWAAMLPERALKPGAGKAATGFTPQDGDTIDAAVHRTAAAVESNLKNGRVL